MPMIFQNARIAERLEGLRVFADIRDMHVEVDRTFLSD
jgi:hypothetical protein